MPKFSELQLKFTGDTTSLTTALRQVNQDIAEAGNQINKQTIGFQRLGSTLSDIGTRLTVGVSLPLVAFGGAALQAAGKMEQAEVAFRTLYKSADVAKTKLEEIKRFAASTPFQFPELVAAARQMAALGFSADELIPVLTKIGNASSSLAMGADGFERIIRAIGQMKQKGTVQAEEFRQLAEAGIPAWEALAKTLGVSIPEAMSMVEKRSVSAAIGIKAVMDVLDERFGGGMAAQAKTFQGMWSNVLDAINFTLADIGKSMLPLGKAIIQDFIYPALNGVKDLAYQFAQLPIPIQQAALAFGGLVAVLGPITFGVGQFALSIVSIVSLTKMIPPIFAAMSAGILATAGNFAAFVTSISGAAAGTALFAGQAAAVVTGIALAAAAVADITGKIFAYMGALNDLKSAELRESEAREKSITLLKTQGANIAPFENLWRKGLLSTQEFDKLLREFAISVGEAHRETAKFDEVAQKLGVSTMKQLKNELKVAKEQLVAMADGYAKGQVSAEAYEKAKARVLDITSRLNPKLTTEADSFRILGKEMQGPIERWREINKLISENDAAKVAENNALAAKAFRDIVEPQQQGTRQIDESQYITAPLKEYDQVMQHVRTTTLSLAEVNKIYLEDKLWNQWVSLDGIAGEYVNRLKDISDGTKRVQLDMPSGGTVNWDAVDRETNVRRAKEGLKQLSIQYGQLTKDAKDSFKAQSKAAQEISTVFNDMYRKMADLIFQGGKFKDMMLGAAEQIGRGFLRLILKAALEPIEKMLSKIADQMIQFIKRIMKDMFTDAFKNLGKMILDAIGGLKSLGSWFGKIFGSKGGGGITDALGGIGYGGVDWGQFPGAPGATKGAGGAASAAGSSVAGIVGAVGSVASAVSGIIGNFQSMATNKSLDILVKHTLQLVMQQEVLRPMISERLVALHDRLMEIRQIGVRVFTTDAALAVSWQGAGPTGAGVGGININMTGAWIGFRDMDSFVDDLVRRIKAQL